MKTHCLSWLVLGSLLAVAGAAAAGEPQVCVKAECVPFLSKIPYISRLFRNVGYASTEGCPEVDQPPCDAACPARNAQAAQQVGPCVIRFRGVDGLERIGIDFDCQECSDEECSQAECCTRHACQRECCTAACVEECEAEVASSPEAAALETALGLQMEMLTAVEEVRNQFQDREDELLAELLEAKVTAAVALTTLQTREAAAKQHSKLERELAAAKVENARLAAKLELAAEKEQLAAELRAAQAELAALKSGSGNVETARRTKTRR